MIQAFLSLLLAMIGLTEASTLASDTKTVKDAATSIFAIIDKKSKIDSSTEEGLTLDPVNGDIDFNHITFKYPSRLDIQIFSDFTLNIPSGKVLIKLFLFHFPFGIAVSPSNFPLCRMLHLLDQVVVENLL